jgi:hypothetical protein
VYDVGSHVIPDKHVCYDLTTMVVTGLCVTT